MNDPAVLKTVQEQYGAVARSGLSNESAAVRAVAEAFGYSEEDLASLPPEANMGLSCGNPVALAGLREGEVVVDLGCGGGLDVLLAAKRVGSTGKAIGIDMTPDMIERAKAGAARVGANNTEFHLAEIDALPLADNSVDCILSNCVINLVADKSRALAEVFRVLKPGGRLVVSDIALKQPLPPEVAQDVQAYVGCIAGAVQLSDYERLLRDAGLESVVVQDTGADLNAYAQAGAIGGCASSGCCSTGDATTLPSSVHGGLTQLLNQFDVNAYAASIRVHALKPKSIPQPTPSAKELKMKTIQVYDKPLCCSTGVCGPEVDPALVHFAADLEWLKTQGHRVERFNLAQQPTAFLQNPEVHQLLATQGTGCLPLVVVDGRIVSRQTYPPRDALESLIGGEPLRQLPLASQGGSCCGGKSCC